MGLKQLLLFGGLGVEGGVLVVALDKDLAGLFGHAASVVLGDRVECPGDVVVPQQVLHQIL